MLDDLTFSGYGDMRTSDGHESPDARTITAQGERLAIVETKVEGLKDDTAVIRSNIHGINQEIQKILIIEQRCENSLNQLLGLTKELPTIAAHAIAFAAMKEQIGDLIVEHDQRQGAWRAITIVATALMGAVSIGGVLTGGALWLFGHIH